MQIAEQNLHGFCRLRPAVWGPGSRPENTQQRQVASRWKIQTLLSVVACMCVVAAVCGTVLPRLWGNVPSAGAAMLHLSRINLFQVKTPQIQHNKSQQRVQHYRGRSLGNLGVVIIKDSMENAPNDPVWCPMPFICTFIPLQLTILRLNAPTFADNQHPNRLNRAQRTFSNFGCVSQG